ncbi:methyltransferase regulatory domain-containing protein [Rhizobium lemnae]|uniref:Class I SAM-dependent methyltransferase n=1 Tax=Rhizobium lemnae TaxID=1214924 RepID=A0ABV8EGY3_9HYPH|nr:class I SAM-dependent methyltransferase [Rhizobium lemnae]MCJ8510522.1 methyltransferase regulatory domain-containing protein [Rhizobium lemnae]
MSGEWNSGYVTDVTYTHGYYQELNPHRARLALIQAGYAAPDIMNACELGFGQGVSIALHAAATEVRWAGTDFNPTQALHAQGLARASGADADLSDQAFAEFCGREELPEFDFIGLHGIWSWISDENRAVIVDFVRRKLKVGGILYISYNTQPGWAAAAPLRHLMTEIGANLISPAGGSTARVEGALDFVDKILSTNPNYLKANPGMKERFEGIKKQNRSYLAHEYFNRDWHPMYVADMARWLGSAKVSFAASAHLPDSVDAINLTPEQQALLKDIPDPILRETVRDYCMNQQFRRDLWVKGARRLTPLERSETLRQQRFLLIVRRSSVPMSITGALGSASLSEAVYTPILDIMSDYKVRTLGDIEAALQGKVMFNQIVQAVLILMGMGAVAPSLDQSAISKSKKKADRLNLHLMERARSRDEIAYLASPVTGGGIQVGRFPQLFALALKAGRKTPQEWVAFVIETLSIQGQRIVKDGQTLETEDENRAELLRQAHEFASQQLPILKALEIV